MEKKLNLGQDYSEYLDNDFDDVNEDLPETYELELHQLTVKDELASQLDGLPDDIVDRINSRLKSQQDNKIASEKGIFNSSRKYSNNESGLDDRKISKAKNETIVYCSDSDSENEGKQKTKRNAGTRRSSCFIHLVPGSTPKADKIPAVMRYASGSKMSGTGRTASSSNLDSKSSEILPPIIAPIMAPIRKDNIYDIDSVGLGSFQVSPLYILQRRSLPASRNHTMNGGGFIAVSSHSQLLPSQTAMNLTTGAHADRYKKSLAAIKSKSRSTFAGRDNDTKTKRNGVPIIEGPNYEMEKQILEMSETIQKQLNIESKHAVKGAGAGVLMPYYSRAQALERMKKTDKALEDYSQCIEIDPQFADAYYKRAELYQLQNKFDLALEDLNKAIDIDPTNIMYRSNRALVLRQKGDYFEAIHETVICKTVELNPNLSTLLQKNEFEKSMDMNLDSRLLTHLKKEEDLILVASKILKRKRTKEQLEAIADFISTMKFFRPYANQPDMLIKIAQVLDFKYLSTNETLFEEGELGVQFYIIYNGEIMITKEVVRKKPVIDIKEDSNNDDKNLNTTDTINNDNSDQTKAVKFQSGDHKEKEKEKEKGTNKFTEKNILNVSEKVESSSESLLKDKNSMKAHDNNNNNNNSKQKFIDVFEKMPLVKLFRGQTFGEVALESNNSIRTAGAVATSPTILLVLNRDDYIEFTKAYKEIIYKGVYSLISCNAIFKNWTKELLARLVSTVKDHSFGPNTDIIKVGEPTKAFYIIKLGVVKIIKPVLKSSLKIHASSKSNSKSDIYSSGRELSPIVTKRKTKKQINKTNRGEQDDFDSSVGKSPREYSVAYKPKRRDPSAFLDGNNSVTNNNYTNDDSSYCSSQKSDLRSVRSDKSGLKDNMKYSILELMERAKVNSDNNDDNTSTANRSSSSSRNSNMYDYNRNEVTESVDDALASVEEQLWVIEKNWRNNILENNTKLKNSNAYVSLDGDSSFKSDTVNFTVSILGAGQTFGELAILDSSIPSPISATTYTPVEVYAFDYEIFNLLEVKSMSASMQILNEMMNIHNPAAEKLAYYFKEKLKWEIKKSRVLKQIKL